MTNTNVDVSEDLRSGSDAVDELLESGALDGLFARIDAGEVQLTGEGGFVPGLIKAALERGLQAELTGHLGNIHWGQLTRPALVALCPCQIEQLRKNAPGAQGFMLQLRQAIGRGLVLRPLNCFL